MIEHQNLPISAPDAQAAVAAAKAIARERGWHVVTVAKVRWDEPVWVVTLAVRVR